MSIPLSEWMISILTRHARGEMVQPGELTNLRTAAGTFAFLAFCLPFATLIAFFCWLHGAYRRAEQLGAAHRLGFSVGDAVVSWFLPVLNLYRPMQVMRGLAAASDPSDLPPATVERDEVAPGYRDPARVTQVVVDHCPPSRQRRGGSSTWRARSAVSRSGYRMSTPKP